MPPKMPSSGLPPTPGKWTHRQAWLDWQEWQEWRRPWKLFTLGVGLAWLIHGALTLGIGDWDVGVSLIMAGLTYLTAPWCARCVIARRWRALPWVVFWWWLAVDGSYSAWHLLQGNPLYREANFPASSCLFWLCGFIWLPRGSLRQILARRCPLI